MHKDVFLLSFLFFSTSRAIGCYRCVSREESLSPIERTQIRNQIDTFFVPVEARSPGCSSSIDEDTPNVELQLCSVYPYCVTLTPNIHDSDPSSLSSNRYVVRGCFELTLRHHLRQSLLKEPPGCFLVRSYPGVPPNGSLDYIVCLCEGDYCNKEPIPSIQSLNYHHLQLKSIERLTIHNGSLQYVSQSKHKNSRFSIFFIVFASIFLYFFHVY